MLRKKLNQRLISFAIVRFGTEIDHELARGGFDDFFLGSARLNRNSIFTHRNIIPS